MSVVLSFSSFVSQKPNGIPILWTIFWFRRVFTFSTLFTENHQFCALTVPYDVTGTRCLAWLYVSIKETQSYTMIPMTHILRFRFQVHSTICLPLVNNNSSSVFRLYTCSSFFFFFQFQLSSLFIYQVETRLNTGTSTKPRGQIKSLYKF